MSDDPRDHISAVAGRSASETGHLVARMQRFCWPGGPTDRTEPAAIAWVRRWRPTRLGASYTQMLWMGLRTKAACLPG